MSALSKPYPICTQSGICFAKTQADTSGMCRCSILYDTKFTQREDGACPFKKQSAFVTDGKLYPYNPNYRA